MCEIAERRATEKRLLEFLDGNVCSETSSSLLAILWHELFGYPTLWKSVCPFHVGIIEYCDSRKDSFPFGIPLCTRPTQELLSNYYDFEGHKLNLCAARFLCSLNQQAHLFELNRDVSIESESLASFYLSDFLEDRFYIIEGRDPSFYGRKHFPMESRRTKWYGPSFVGRYFALRVSCAGPSLLLPISETEFESCVEFLRRKAVRDDLSASRYLFQDTRPSYSLDGPLESPCARSVTTRYLCALSDDRRKNHASGSTEMPFLSYQEYCDAQNSVNGRRQFSKKDFSGVSMALAFNARNNDVLIPSQIDGVKRSYCLLGATVGALLFLYRFVPSCYYSPYLSYLVHKHAPLKTVFSNLFLPTDPVATLTTFESLPPSLEPYVDSVHLTPGYLFCRFGSTALRFLQSNMISTGHVTNTNSSYHFT